MPQQLFFACTQMHANVYINCSLQALETKAAAASMHFWMHIHTLVPCRGPSKMFARAAFRMSHKSLVQRILILTFLLFSWIFVGTQISRFPDPIYRFQIFQKSGLGQKLKPGMGPSLGPSAINCIVCKLGLMIVLDINLYMETEAAWFRNGPGYI